VNKIFNAIIETDAAILADVEQMNNQQESELSKFNKMLDAFKMDLAGEQNL
jgi:hypothetical protein